MDTNVLRPVKRWILAPAIAALLAGCVFDPAEQTGPGEPPAEPKPFTSIQNTMENFRQAHEEQDIELYRSCLKAEYQFFLDPADADEVGRDFFSKQDDVAQMEAIFDSPDLVDIRFRATPHEIVDRCWGDGTCVSSLDARWAEIYYTVEIEIEWVDGVERACGTAVFSFTLADPSAIGIVRVLDFTGQSSC